MFGLRRLEWPCDQLAAGKADVFQHILPQSADAEWAQPFPQIFQITASAGVTAPETGRISENTFINQCCQSVELEQ